MTAAKDTPVLFNGDMVRAILAGTKAETRRPLRHQPCGSWGTDTDKRGLLRAIVCSVPDIDRLTGPTPKWHNVAAPAAEGDRLWVRETWGVHWMYDGISPTSLKAEGWDGPPDSSLWYAATDTPPPGLHERWRPSIHMPRWASRITLPVVEVRVERVQDITEEGARSEGVEPVPAHGRWVTRPRQEGGHWSARKAFAGLWDSIYGRRPGLSWEANPWVWVVRWDGVEVRS